MHFRIFETWRLTAALLVMVWHFLLSSPDGAPEVRDLLRRLLPLLEMFFMISGFLIMMRYGEELGREKGSYARFLLRRLARFYPLYLATLLFFAVVAVAVHLGFVQTTHPGRYDFAALPANLILVQAWGLTDELTFNYVAWCLSAEWFCYLALPVIVYAFRWFRYPGLISLALLSILLLEAATAAGLIPSATWLEADTFGAYRAFADFAMGALVAMAVRDCRWELRSHAVGWSAFALAVTAMLTLQPAALIIVLLAAAMFLAALAERNNPDGSRLLAPLRPLGAVSFGIYLIHPVMETVFFSVLWRGVVAPSGVVGFYVYWLLPIAVTLAAALFSARWFEKPAADLILRGFGGGRKAGTPAPLAGAGGVAG